jgi:hypothetical protein
MVVAPYVAAVVVFRLVRQGEAAIRSREQPPEPRARPAP